MGDDDNRGEKQPEPAPASPERARFVEASQAIGQRGIAAAAAFADGAGKVVSIIGGAVMVGSAVFAVPFGILADKWNKRNMLFFATIVSSLGGILLSLVSSLPLLALTGLLWQAFSVAMGIASVAWLKDLLPEQNRGKFLGIRMIFWIAIPMVIGPWIGSTLIQNFGTPTTLNGQAGFVPAPIIFQVGSAISMLALIPLFFINDKK